MSIIKLFSASYFIFLWVSLGIFNDCEAYGI